MKNLTNIALRLFSILVLTLFIGCSHSEIEIQEEEPKAIKSEIVGEWWMSVIEVNDKPIADYPEYPQWSKSILGLKESGFYFLDYNAGQWDLDVNTLTLNNSRVCEILKYQDSVMIVESNISEKLIYYQLEGIEEYEIIKVKQRLVRQ